MSKHEHIIVETFEDGHTIKKIKYLDKNYKLSRKNGPALVEFDEKQSCTSNFCGQFSYYR